MPTYLCHGFRWQRRSVRVYVILQNLDDASPEWIIPATTSQCILKSFYEVFEFLPYCSPKGGRYTPTRETDSDDGSRILHYGISNNRSQSRGRSQSQSTSQSRSQSRATQQQRLPPAPTIADESSSSSISSSEDDFSAQSWSAVKLLEEYDPRDLTAVSRPYAYVADYAVRVDLSCSIIDEIARYEQQQLQSSRPAISIPSRNAPAQSPGWFEELRDQLQHGEEIGWYVVVNNDEVRDWLDEPPEPEPASPPKPGSQQYLQYQPHSQQTQQQQPYQHQHQHQPQPNRPIATREQRQHHAQYIHQQQIFDREEEQAQALEQEQHLIPKGHDREQTLEEQKQKQKQLLLEKSEQQRKRDQEQQQRLLLEKIDQQRKRDQEQQQQMLAWKEQELRKERARERERQRQRQQEKERDRERDRKKEEEKERQRAQKPRLNGIDPDGKPPMVPEKDYRPRPPTANPAPNPPPLNPKMPFDAGASGRPKTPGGKGGGLRRLFGRGRVEAGYSP
ncbi:hypothetical protein C8A00DRAFT_34801 [Chaetomidium leptoderma]|uniref:Uncharacterized protein n=1 Tax=Chaetomidium leptoderma TaxID=669021 RepID=A0AAN6VJN5_9PEZI|nr:hypothetical protein C8A00DRAFT_34801 [Chaetomidium leptoderma]